MQLIRHRFRWRFCFVQNRFQADGVEFLGYVSDALTLVISLASSVHLFLEYAGHSRLVQPASQRMGKIWICVFVITLVIKQNP